MALDTFASNDLSNYIIYDTISASDYPYQDSSQSSFFFGHIANGQCNPDLNALTSSGFNENLHSSLFRCLKPSESGDLRPTQGKKKRRRKPKICINKEEAEAQRMTHITVERNRRKQMNEHLAILRSLMPESYVQRGDQASIVGGAIDFVKELEQLLQSLEAQKRVLQQQTQERGGPHSITNVTSMTNINTNNNSSSKNHNNKDLFVPPFAQFFSYPQYLWSQFPREHPLENQPAIADIEVTMIETHANLRILSKRRPKQLLKMVAGFHSLCLTILHLNVTTLDQFVLYSFSAKVEEGCHLNSVDEIAGAVHHLLTIIEEEASLCSTLVCENPQMNMGLPQNYHNTTPLIFF
ncbi:beta HLH protein 71 [Tasmannia lanceolata]|uniref:beta HLH protein 71 n=1 Tax=Tasmannia lanceolata TaxID=3420 RepID=UPI004064BE70